MDMVKRLDDLAGKLDRGDWLGSSTTVRQAASDIEELRLALQASDEGINYLPLYQMIESATPDAVDPEET